MDEKARALNSLNKLEAYLKELRHLEKSFSAPYSLAAHYYNDSRHYFDKGDYFTSFGCSDYAYGLLDAIFLVKKHQLFPEPTAGALILNSRGQIFLMKSHKWHGKLTVPGGHVEIGETIEQALKREIKEETNLDIYDVRHLFTHEFIHGAEFWKKRHFIFFDYTCRAENEGDVKLNSEGQEYLWLSLEDALNRGDVEPYTKKALIKLKESQTPRI